MSRSNQYNFLFRFDKEKIPELCNSDKRSFMQFELWES